jgi:hypothetical protein
MSAMRANTISPLDYLLSISFEDIPKAIIMRRTEGIIKMTIHSQTRHFRDAYSCAKRGRTRCRSNMLAYQE